MYREKGRLTHETHDTEPSLRPRRGEIVAPESDSPAFHYSARQRADLLEYAGESCTNRQRLVLVLRYGEGLSLEEIAAELKVSRSAVNQMHERALFTLLTALRRLGILDLRQIL